MYIQEGRSEPSWIPSHCLCVKCQTLRFQTGIDLLPGYPHHPPDSKLQRQEHEITNQDQHSAEQGPVRVRNPNREPQDWKEKPVPHVPIPSSLSQQQGRPHVAAQMQDLNTGEALLPAPSFRPLSFSSDENVTQQPEDNFSVGRQQRWRASSEQI